MHWAEEVYIPACTGQGGVHPSMHWAGGAVCPEDGCYLGGVCPGGVVCPGGDVCPGGAQGYVAEADTPHVETDRHL